MATSEEGKYLKIVGFHGTSGTYLKSIGAHMMPTETVRTVGTFGGAGGGLWDDGKHTGIKQIKIVYGLAIDSITTEYDDNGVSTWSAKHGGNGGGNTVTITLDQPDEFLGLVSGYYSVLNGVLILVSLTFHSNKRTFGPYGPKNGTNFSFPSFGGKIVGFFGKSGKYLDSIGAHIVVPAETVQSAGTFGGPGGGFWDDGKHTGIKQIKIVYGLAIDSIAIEYDDNGVSTWSNKHGGNGGGNTATITLDQPDEFLVLVSGYYSILNGLLILVSLTFQSNKRTFGPYGPKNGTYFSFPSFRGKIVGFFGKSGTYLDSIGAHIVPAQIVQSVGTFGGPGGGFWDDGKHNGIKQIKIVYGLAIDSITIEYEDNGVSKWSAKHGGNGGGNTAMITLDQPEEFLVLVSGYYSILNGVLILVSLTFHSNKRTFGPYGPKNGKYFSFPSFGGKIVGFFGNSGMYLDSIGAHVVPTESMQSVGAFGGPGGGYWDDGVHFGIKQIKVVYGSAIDSITTEYDDNGVSTWSTKHGGKGGGTTATITLDQSDEFLVLVSGYYSILNGVLILVSLTFQSNKRMFGPYGPKNGTYFSFPSFGGKIVGFFGKSGMYLDSIGAYVKPVPALFYPFYVESFGGKGGNPSDKRWDDGVYDSVRKVTVGPSDHGIQHVSFEYDKNGQSVVAQEHGDKTIKLYHAELELPDEFLISVSGHYDEGTGAIQSLKFQTNKDTLGPYGVERGTPF